MSRSRCKQGAARGLAILLIFAAAASGGCAAIVRGSSQAVRITSEPEGLGVTVDGQRRVTTPAVIELSRRRSHLLEADAPDVEPPFVTVVSHIEDAGLAWFTVGALVFNVFEFISLATGSVYGLTPLEVHFERAEEAPEHP